MWKSALASATRSLKRGRLVDLRISTPGASATNRCTSSCGRERTGVHAVVLVPNNSSRMLSTTTIGRHYRLIVKLREGRVLPFTQRNMTTTGGRSEDGGNPTAAGTTEREDSSAMVAQNDTGEESDEETANRAWNYGFTEYTTGQGEEQSHTSFDEKEMAGLQRTPNGRNKRLLHIARAGMVHLNRAALYIRKDPKTSKGIEALSEEGMAPNKEQLSEEHRIFAMTQECLERMCIKDPGFPLMAGSEPILLVGCQVNVARTDAIIYWCLPESVLTARDLNYLQRSYIQEEMRNRLEGQPGRMLSHMVTQRLSHYFPPKVRFKEAPLEIVKEVVREYEEF